MTIAETRKRIFQALSGSYDENEIRNFSDLLFFHLLNYSKIELRMKGNEVISQQDEKTLDGSLWQRGEHIHRGIIFKEEDRHELQGSIAQTENQMLGIMGKNGFQPSPDDLMAADGLVKDWMNYWYEKYKNEKIHYPVFSLHSQFWKYINEREGFS